MVLFCLRFPFVSYSVSVSFFLSLHYGDRKLFNPLAEVDISTYKTQNLKPFFAKKFLSDLYLYFLWVFFLAPSSNKLTSLFFLPLIDFFLVKLLYQSNLFLYSCRIRQMFHKIV